MKAKRGKSEEKGKAALAARGSGKAKHPMSPRRSLLVVLAIVIVLGAAVVAWRLAGNGGAVGKVAYEDVKGSEVFILFDLDGNAKGGRECAAAISLFMDGKQVYSQDVYCGIFTEGNTAKKVLVEMDDGKTNTVVEQVCKPAITGSLDFRSIISTNGNMAAACNGAATLEEKIICGILVGRPNLAEYVDCFDGRDQAARFYCLATVSGDYTLCNNLNGDMFYDCLAATRADKSYCGFISDGAARQGCYK